jgi:hypothetical protein
MKINRKMDENKRKKTIRNKTPTRSRKYLPYRDKRKSSA